MESSPAQSSDKPGKRTRQDDVPIHMGPEKSLKGFRKEKMRLGEKEFFSKKEGKSDNV